MSTGDLCSSLLTMSGCLVATGPGCVAVGVAFALDAVAMIRGYRWLSRVLIRPKVLPH